MQLYFIRHAQSSNNLLYDLTGSSLGRSDDPELTPTGLKQAEKLAEFLSQPFYQNGRDTQNRNGYGITHLYCSLMQRAALTGAAVARKLDLPLVPWYDVHEVGGIYLVNEDGEPQGRAGKPRSFFEKHIPELKLPDWLSDAGWWNRPMETLEEGQVRARRVLAELLRRHGEGDDRVAIVSHGAFFGCFMSAFLDIANVETIWFEKNNTGISRLDFSTEGKSLVYLNKLEHLSNELIT
jgi:2,3-bisphosphoglycerate-dependent phosphoglycerate mutase